MALDLILSRLFSGLLALVLAIMLSIFIAAIVGFYARLLWIAFLIGWEMI